MYTCTYSTYMIILWECTQTCTCNDHVHVCISLLFFAKLAFIGAQKYIVYTHLWDKRYSG